MSDLVTAAKTLRALGDGDEGLKCVESDPPEIQRTALKKIRRAAGPAVAAFTMGILKYPRRAQGVLMDALHAARSTLYAADAESLFFRQGSDNENKSVVMGKSMINRRSSTNSVGASTTQGTLAARCVGIEMLREHGARVGNNEDLGRTKFELTVAGGQMRPWNFRSRFNAEQAKASSMERELRAIADSFEQWAPALAGQHMLWWTDSLCAYFAIRNGTRKREANALVKRIYATTVVHGISLFVEWVPREWSQRADDLSKSEEERTWSLHPRVFAEAQRRLRRCDVDRFASVRCHQLPRFNVKWFAGWRAPHRAEAVDAFSQDWSEDVNWLNPPFGLLHKALALASSQQACGLVVVPHATAWRYASWWSSVWAEEPPAWMGRVVPVEDLASAAGLAASQAVRLNGEGVASPLPLMVVEFDFSRGELGE